MTDRTRLPDRDDPWWTEAPIPELFAPLTSERIRPASPYEGAGHNFGAGTVEKRIAEKRGMGWRKITDEKRAHIIRRVNDGLAYREIALEVDVGQSTVERVAAEEGIGRGQGQQAPGAATCERCGRGLAERNRSGVCTKCKRGKRP